MRKHFKHIETMKNILIPILLSVSAAVSVQAQEPAQYRITYDCDALFGETRKVYRWALDVGTQTAVFYSPNNRAKEDLIDDVVRTDDVNVVMARIRSSKSLYPNANPLEVLVKAAPVGRYTYLNKINSDRMWYEEKLPAMDWETTERDTTVCGYTCFQARASVYGRTWTVWFAPEIPAPYGPYLLGGLPGLILDAEDADGLFHFTAVGLEQAPTDATVELSGIKDAIKCQRKKFLSLRDQANGQSLNESLRALNLGDNAVVRVVSENGEELDPNTEMPKKNYLDLK